MHITTQWLMIVFENIINLNLKNILFGYGSVGHKFIVKNKIETGTDFGILTPINQLVCCCF